MKSKILPLVISAAVLMLPNSCIQQETPVAGAIELSEQEMTVPAEGGVFTVEVNTSEEFTVSILTNWITPASKQESYTGGAWSYAVDTYEGLENRSAQIIFYTGAFSDTLTVTQTAMEDTLYDQFIESTAPGFYAQGHDGFVYEDLSSQYSLTLSSDGKYSHRILTLYPARFFTAAGIPSDAEEGTSCTVSVSQNFTTELDSSFQLELTVEKIADGKIWMYNHTERKGIIITDGPELI